MFAMLSAVHLLTIFSKLVTCITKIYWYEISSIQLYIIVYVMYIYRRRWISADKSYIHW